MTVLCTRCGDFACPECLREFPPEKALCPACLDRVDVPEKLRLTAEPTVFPTSCPTCNEPATTGIALQYRGGFAWPHCARCAADETRMRARTTPIVWTTGLLVVGLRIALANNAPTLWVVPAAVVVAAAGGLAYHFTVRALVRQRRPGTVTFGVGLQLTYERQLPTFKRIYVVKIFNTRYARLFAALNEGIIKR
jgi:hypothetical protein